MSQGTVQAVKDLLINKKRLKSELQEKEKKLHTMIDIMDPEGPCLISEIAGLKDRIVYINNLINTLESGVNHA